MCDMYILSATSSQQGIRSSVHVVSGRLNSPSHSIFTGFVWCVWVDGLTDSNSSASNTILTGNAGVIGCVMV